MKERKSAVVGHARVVSAVPGRIRVKVHSEKKSPEMMNAVKESMRSHEGIHDVSLNHNTGSITVRYDHHRHTKEGVMKFLEDFDTVFQFLGQEAEFTGAEDGSEDAFASAGFVEALNDLNRRIYGKTGIPVNLKLLMPLLFAGAGLWSISKRGLMIEAVPGWLFLWFAFDIFVKLHPSEAAKA